MKQALALIAVVIALCFPVFAQNSSGGGGLPRLDSIPDDVVVIQENDPNNGGMEQPIEPDVKKHAAKRLLQKVAFLQIDRLSKRLMKKISTNVADKCHEDFKVIGYKSLAQYLENRILKDTVQMGSLNAASKCKKEAVDCVFKDGAEKIFSKLIHDPYFETYLVEKKKWKAEDAKSVNAFFLKVDDRLKAKQ